MKYSIKTFVASAIAGALIIGCQKPSEESSTPTAAPRTNLPPPVRVREELSPVPVVDTPAQRAPTPSKRKLAWLTAEIERQDKRATELWDYAAQFDDYFHIGTMFNELNIPEHRCYVLGHLLRRGALVTHLEVQYGTDMSDTSTDGTHAMRVDGHSMRNFVGVAGHLLTTPPDERVSEWNVDCVGQHDIPPDAYIATSGAQSFQLIRNEGKVLQILGDIEPGFADKVQSALDENPGIEVVALGSGGGVVAEAIKAGMIIRDRKLTTSLWNNCYSACPLVFLGGYKREIWSPYPKLGFHQIYTLEEGASAVNSPVYHVIRTYVQTMGADANYVLLNMWMAGPAEMNYIDPGNHKISLCDRGIATWVQRNCRIPDAED